MARLNIQNLCKSFGQTRVLSDINLTIEDSEFVVFVGPSGCGKSTLLRLICGLDEVSSGQIAIDGELVNDVPPAKRGIAMVFQSYALYPHMTVAQNMGYALRLAKADKQLIDARVRKAADILKISDYLQRKPRQLSGGQRQRVAIGRAIVREPKVFLFDEPLSNLDAALRVDMRMEFGRLKERLGTTMIYVTHDQVEAMTLASKIVVLNDGRVEQIGTPIELYMRPVNRFVAGFIGSPKMNFLPVHRIDGGQCLVPGGRLDLGDTPAHAREIGVRPEQLRLAEAGNPDTLQGQVVLSEHLGSDTYAYVALEGMDTPILVRLAGEQQVHHGEVIGVAVDRKVLHLVDETGAVTQLGRDPALRVA